MELKSISSKYLMHEHSAFNCPKEFEPEKLYELISAFLTQKFWSF